MSDFAPCRLFAPPSVVLTWRACEFRGMESNRKSPKSSLNWFDCDKCFPIEKFPNSRIRLENCHFATSPPKGNRNTLFSEEDWPRTFFFNLIPVIEKFYPSLSVQGPVKIWSISRNKQTSHENREVLRVLCSPPPLFVSPHSNLTIFFLKLRPQTGFQPIRKQSGENPPTLWLIDTKLSRLWLNENRFVGKATEKE